MVVAIGGERLLGYWSVAYRLMQLPFWVLQALWRVSYPMMARLRAHGEDTRLTVERFARVTALVSGAVLAPLAVSAHFVVPALFGATGLPARPVALGQRRPACRRSDFRCRCGLSLLGGRRADAARRDRRQRSCLGRPYGDSSSPTGNCGCRHRLDGRFVDRGRALRAGSRRRAASRSSRMILVPVAVAVASALLAPRCRRRFRAASSQGSRARPLQWPHTLRSASRSTVPISSPRLDE